MAQEEKKKIELPPEVYYLVLNGAKQYFKNHADAEDMARGLYESGISPGGIYTETDPDEIQDLYDVGYFKEEEKQQPEEPKEEVEVKEEVKTPSAYKGHLEEEDPPKSDITEEDVERFGKEALKGLSGKKAWEEEDELDAYTKDLEDYKDKNPKGRDDIPVTTRR